MLGDKQESDGQRPAETEETATIHDDEEEEDEVLVEEHEDGTGNGIETENDDDMDLEGLSDDEEAGEREQNLNKSRDEIGFDREASSAPAPLALRQYASGEINTSRQLSTLDYTSIETLMRGGLPRLYQKLTRDRGGKPYNYEIVFHKLAFKARLKIRDPASITSWASRPIQRVAGLAESDKKTVIYPASGTIPAGSLTLLMGGPGSGKTTLLNLLAGVVPRSKIQDSFLCVNGMDVRKVARKSKTIGLVPQRDEHFATLTVRETLDFARTCHNGVTAEDDKLGRLQVDFIMKMLGIAHRADTIVGSAAAGLRGVSGGERKRVTIGEVIVGNFGVLIMDEINTGLDSQATLDVIQSIRHWCDCLGGTAVVSLLQPQSDVLALFDRIMLLNDGRIVYNGLISDVESHFESLGIERPGRMEVTDWLLKDVCGASNPDELMEAAGIESPNAGSSIWEEHEQKLKSGTLSEVKFDEKRSRFALSFFQDLVLVLNRQWKLNIRNKSLVNSLLMEAIIIGLLLGLAFFQTEVPEEVFGLLFYLASVLIRQGWQIIPIVLDDRNIFYKQRAVNMYRTSTYVIALSLAQLPINVVAMVLLGVIVIFMCNLADSAPGPFFATLFTLIFLQQALRAWMSTIAAASPNANIAQGFAAIFVILSLLFSGFIIVEDLIPNWAIWIFWLNPIAFGIRSLALIEFTSDRYEGDEGNEILESFGFTTNENWIYGGMGVLVFYYFVFGFYFTFIGFHVVRPRQNYSFRVKPSKNSATTKRNATAEASTSLTSSSEEGEIVLTLESNRSVSSTNLGKGLSQRSQRRHEKPRKGNNKEVHHLEEGRGPDLQDGSTAGFKPVSLTVRNLRYEVRLKNGDSLPLLQGVNAHVPSGTLTALMGSSGAGKSTLMDVIAGRKTEGTISGDVLINGEKIAPVPFARMIGYVEQFDVFSPTQTVRESMIFSSTLRRTVTGTMTKSHEEFVDDVIDLLEMGPIENSRIGEGGTGGLGIEQRKRVSIGIELSANPSILFLDEPTSGLDSNGAHLVVDSIRAVANSGRTVICTVHQPSTELFAKFQNLLLLQRGGQIVFYGPIGKDADHLISYFQGIPDTPKIEPKENPASYMLRAIGAGISTGDRQLPDYASVYNRSRLCAENSKVVHEMCEMFENKVGNGVLNEDGTSKEPQGPTYSQSLATQLWICYSRMQSIYFRSPEYTLLRLLLSVFMGLFLGGVFFQLGFDTQDRVQSQVGLIYLYMDIIGLLSLVLVVPITFRERAVFYKETTSFYYAKSVHAGATILTELPYIFLTSFLFMVIIYFMVGFEQSAANFFYFAFIWFLFLCATTYEGAMLSFALPTASVTQVVIGIFTGVLNIFSGFLLPRDQIPGYLLLFYYVNPDTYALNGMVTSNFGVCKEDIDGNEILNSSIACQVVNNGTTVAQFIQDFYAFQPERRFIDAAVLVGWVAAVLLGTVYSTMNIRYIKR